MQDKHHLFCITNTDRFFFLKLFRFQRPTAQELLKHKFLKQAKKTSYLVDLIDRYKRWKAAGGEEDAASLAAAGSRVSRMSSGDSEDG